MRILVHGNASLGDGYPRNRVLLHALERSGCTVLYHHRALFRDPSQRKRLVRPDRLLGTLPKLLGNQWWLHRNRPRAADFDAVFVPYGGLMDLRSGRRIARRFGVPLATDAFLSLHEAVVWDRAAFRPGSLGARLALKRDLALLQGVDLLLVDTVETGTLLHDLFGPRRARVVAVPVGSDLEPQELPPEQSLARFLFVGTGVPLHGTRALLQAWSVAEDRCSRPTLTFVGGTARDRERARELGLRRVDFIDHFVLKEELARRHAECDVVLGVFAPRPKTARVVPCKIHDALACGRGVITLATPALERACPLGSGVVQVRSPDRMEIAQWILRASEGTLARELALQARRHHARHFRADAIGRPLRSAFEEVCGRTRTAPSGARHQAFSGAAFVSS